jgi:hypothetical protein
MPPEYPGEKPARGAFLRNLLRPEFVKSYKTPLSSDAFSGFVAHGSVEDEEVKQATMFLYQNVIPKCARELSQSSFSDDFPQLVSVIHSAGINLRHMGLLRARVTRDEVKTLLLIEIVARTLRKLLWAELREEINAQKYHMPTEQAMRYRIAKFYNNLLTNVDYWKDPRHLKSKILERFPQALSDKECSVLESLTKFITPASRLLSRLQALTSVTINSKTFQEMEKFFQSTVDVIVPSDVTIVAKVKEMKLVSVARISVLVKEGKEKKSLPERVQSFKNALNYIVNRSSPEMDIHTHYTTRYASYKLLKCLLKFPEGEIKWSEVEQYQTRFQNLKPTEDYGKSPEEQFDNLVLRGDIERLLVHIYLIQPREGKTSVPCPLDMLKRLCMAASWYLRAIPFATQLLKLPQKKRDDSPATSESKKTQSPVEKLEAKCVKLIKKLLEVIFKLHSATKIDFAQSDAVLNECAKHLHQFLATVTPQIFAKVTVPTATFSVSSLHVLHHLATQSDKIAKEFIPHVFNSLPKLISVVSDASPWPLNHQQLLSVVRMLPPDKDYNILSFDSYAQIDDQILANLRDYKILTFSARRCPMITSNTLKFLAKRSLAGIILDGTSIDDGGLALLAAQCPTIQHVSVLGCRVTTSALFSLVRSCLSIETIFAQWTGNAFPLNDCPHLTDKFLEKVQLSNQTPLQSMSLAGCVRVTDDAIRSFFQRHAPVVSTLRNLDLSGCTQLSQACLDTILQLCPNLQELSLSQCRQFGNAAVGRVAYVLQGTLRVLDLSYCWEVTDEGVKALSRSTSSLMSLSLKQCDKVTFDSMARLVSTIPTLVLLDVSYCWRLGLPQLQRLKRPTLQIKYGRGQSL